MLCITILQLLIGLITKLLLALKQLASSILKEYVSLVKRPSALQCHRLLQSSGGSVAHKTRGSRFCSGPLSRQDAAARFCWEVSSATQLPNQQNPGCQAMGTSTFPAARSLILQNPVPEMSQVTWPNHGRELAKLHFAYKCQRQVKSSKTLQWNHTHHTHSFSQTSVLF